MSAVRCLTAYIFTSGWYYTFSLLYISIKRDVRRKINSRFPGTVLKAKKTLIVTAKVGFKKNSKGLWPICELESELAATFFALADECWQWVVCAKMRNSMTGWVQIFFPSHNERKRVRKTTSCLIFHAEIQDFLKPLAGSWMICMASTSFEVKEFEVLSLISS